MAPDPRHPRSDALDALRGYSILTMALSGLVPWGTLPAWMYHAQLAPPTMKFNPAIAGLTWVDLVFPFFLFSMGAAIPLALAPRLARGEAPWRLALIGLRRGLLLIAFALYVQHAAPYTMSKQPVAATWLLSLLAFALLFPALTRLPGSWPAQTRLLVRAAGWGGMLAWVWLYWYAGGGEPALSAGPSQGVLDAVNRVAARSDIIIVVLANTIVTATLVWLLTRASVPLRLGIMIGVIALRLAKDSPGWVRDVWLWQPVPSLCQLYFQQYLLVVLPGTIVGDLIAAWLRREGARRHAEPPAVPAARESRTYLLIAAGMVTLIVVVLTGLQARWVTTTACVSVGLCAAVAWLMLPAKGALRRLHWGIFRWSVLWLLLGLVLEPYEGGIKKDPSTLSYYFVTSGLAGFGLVALGAVIDGLRQAGPLRLLIDAGQNPMIAYAGIRSFLAPVVHLTGLEALLVKLLNTPWLGVVRAVLKTLLLAVLTSLLTRLRIYWRT